MVPKGESTVRYVLKTEQSNLCAQVAALSETGEVLERER